LNRTVSLLSVWFIALMVLLGASIALADTGSNKALNEANASFTYKGRPIHPFLFETLSNWLSDDRPPMATTVDIAAAHDSNRYMLNDIQKRDDWWFSERKQELGNSLSSYEAFGYHWLGKMADGVHVVETGFHGGGSGFFMDLVFIKFSKGEIYFDHEKAPQCLMTIVGIHYLGDRYEGEIKVYPDKVFIPASEVQFGSGAINKDVEIRSAIFDTSKTVKDEEGQ